MNTAFPNARNTANTRSLAGTVMLSLAALVACQAPPPGVMAATAEASTPATAMPAAAMPAPQAPFDSTPITPVESAGAAAA